MARLNPKHVDVRARIVQKTTNKVSQTVCRWRHVRRWGWVGPNIREGFGRVSCGEVSIIAIVILLDLLRQMIWLERYIEKQGHTHRSKRVCLGRDRLSNSVILMHIHIWNLWDVRILLCVSQSEGRLNINDYRLQVEGEDGSVPHCNCARQCVVDTAFRPAYLHYPLVAGRPPAGRPPGRHQPHEGSKV